MDIREFRSKFPQYGDLSDGELVDALHRRFYSDMPRSAVAESLGVKAPTRSLMAVANDTVIEAANAVAGGVGSVADFVSPGNRVSKFIDENIVRPGEESQSDAVKAEKQRFQNEVQAADGIGGELAAVGGYVLRNPLQAAAQAVGSFAVPGAAIKGGSLMARAAGLNAARAGVAGGVGAGAALSGGDAAGTAYDLVKQAGGSEEEAVAAAREASVIPAVIGGAGGAFGAERLFAGAGKAATGIRGRALAGLSEAAQEGIEEGATQFEAQRAAAKFDPSIDPTKGVAAAAGMGAVLGGATGVGVSMLSPHVEQTARADDGMRRIANAQTTDEAIAGALDAMNVPLAAGLTADQENRALSSLEAQAKDDQATIKQAGRMDKTGLPPLPGPRAPSSGVDGSAAFIDSPFIDRLVTLREQIEDPQVRARIREQFGDEALSEVMHYASIADRPDLKLPDKTTDRLLGVAEAIVSRAIAQPVSRPGVTGAAPESAIGMTPRVPQIALDTTPTGTIRVDSSGAAAPETRADQISLRDRARAMRERRDGMTAQAPTEPRPAQPAAPAPRVGYDTSPTGRMVAGADGVRAETRADSINLRQRVDAMKEKRQAKAKIGLTPDVESAQAKRKDASDVAALAGVGGQRAADAERGAGDQRLPNEQPGQIQGSPRRTVAQGDAGASPAGDGSGQLHDALTTAANEAATSPLNDRPEPTDAQKAAGNYAKGHARISGMDVSIENPKGSIRRSKADDAISWEVEMPAHYGYIRGTKGSDGDHVDLFIGEHGDNGRFWVVNQNKADGSGFDEHKVITGVNSAEEAVDVYKGSFADDFGDKVFSSVSSEFDAGGIKAELPKMRKAKPVTGVNAGATADAGEPAAVSVPEASSTPAAAPAPTVESGTAPTEAQHLDPGEASEPATQPVIAESLKKAARAEDRTPAQMRSGLLRQIDEAIAKAPERDKEAGTTEPKTVQGKRQFSGVRGAIRVEVREGSDGKWHVADLGLPWKDRAKKAEIIQASTPTLARRVVETMLSRASLNNDGYIVYGESDFITFDVPGDGSFKVLNQRDRLEEFRTKVEKSPGFSATGQKPAVPAKPPALASAGAKAAIENMVEEGDFEAALDYATAKGVSLDDLKLAKSDRQRLDDWLKANPQPTEQADDESAAPEELPPETRETDAGVAIFSRTEAKDENETFANELREAIQPIAESWKNGPAGGVEVVQSEQDLPPRVLRGLKAANAEGEARALFVPSSDAVYLIADNLGSIDEAQFALFHEVYGHHGMRSVLGDDYQSEMLRLRAANPSLATEASMWFARYGSAEVQARVDAGMTREDAERYVRALSVEEALADRAAGVPELRGWRRIAAKIQAFLRSIGLDVVADWMERHSETESIALLVRARQAVHGDGDTQPAVHVLSEHPLASRAATMSIDQQEVRNRLSDLLGSAGARVSMWDKTLGTQYAKAQKFPEFKRVFEGVQAYIEDTSRMANEAADEAPGILPKLETWRDLKLGDLKNWGLSKADAKAIAAPIFEGTLTEKRVFEDDELRDRFGLTQQQVGLYRQFLSAVNTSLDQMVAADVQKLVGDMPRQMRFLDRAALRTGLQGYLQQRIDRATGPEKESLEATLEDVRARYERVDQLKAEGYAPLMRFGKYFVNIDRGGESMFFGLYESKADANKAARELAEDPEFKGAEIRQGVLSQKQYEQFAAVPIETLEMFAEAIGAEESEVFQAYLKLAKNNRSALKRLIHRKGTAGFSQDVDRVLAAFVTSNSRLAAGALNLPQASKHAEAIRDGDVKDEALGLIEAVQKPADTAASVRALLFINMIGGSIASAVVNLSQPITMTLPYLSQWGGIGKAASRLMSAAKVVAGGRMPPDLKTALKRAEDDGIVSPQEIHHLQAQASAAFGTNPILKRIAFVWGAPFGLAEQFNRRVSFVAAYQTAQAEGIADPFDFAERAVVETQGLYNRGNAPNLARSAPGAAALTFKQFSIHYIEWLGRMAKSGPQGKRAVAFALAILIAAAGTEGLPFADDIDDLIDTLAQAMGYDTSAKQWKTKAMTAAFGGPAAEVLMHGLSSLPGVPIDVSVRMGMGNLLPATGLFLRSNTDRTRDVLEIAGPAGALAKQYMDAGKKALAGDVGGAVEASLPMALQNAWKGLGMWSTGEYRDSKGAKVLEVDDTASVMKFFGFQPSEVARESRRISEFNRSEQLAKNVESEIAAKWARGIAEGDRDAVLEARKDLADWNAKNDEKIRITSAQIAQRVKKLRQSRSERFVKSVAPERRASAVEALR